MKTLEEVKEEIKYGDVFTLHEFIALCRDEVVSPYDGIGYFHDGEKRTNISVWDENLTLDILKNCPYVCWYNK